MKHTPKTNKLKLEIQGHTAVVTNTNPPANTWDIESLTALRDLVKSLDQDKSVYALVLCGDGEKFFSAGADLKMFADGDKARARQVAKIFGEALETLSQYGGVTIAAIQGYAMGGGLEAALACDIRICEPQSQMALPEAAVGLLPCGGGTQNLPMLVGEAWAKRIILCGERVNAETALKIGLVEEIAEKGQAKAKALELAAKVGAQSPSSVRACKQLIQASRFHAPFQALTKERELFVDLFDTQDQKEGVNAFLEKRKPAWKNG
jgi:enoyl-CoA hydratase/carnithine racemase